MNYIIWKVIPWVVLGLLVLPFPIVMLIWRTCSKNETENREGCKTKMEKWYYNFLKNRCKDFFNSPSGSLDRELKDDEDLKTIDGKTIPEWVYFPLGNYLLIALVLAVFWVFDTILHVSTTCHEDYTCFNQSYLMAEPISNCSEMNESAPVICYKAVLDYEQALANIGGVMFTSHSMLRLSSILAKLLGSCYRKARFGILVVSVFIVIGLFLAGLITGLITGFLHTTLWYFKVITHVGFLSMASLIPWEILYVPENTETNIDQLQLNTGGGGAVATGQGSNSSASDSQSGHVSLEMNASFYDFEQQQDNSEEGEMPDDGSYNGNVSSDLSMEGNGRISSVIRKRGSSENYDGDAKAETPEI